MGHMGLLKPLERAGEALSIAMLADNASALLAKLEGTLPFGERTGEQLSDLAGLLRDAIEGLRVKRPLPLGDTQFRQVEILTRVARSMSELFSDAAAEAAPKSESQFRERLESYVEVLTRVGAREPLTEAHQATKGEIIRFLTVLSRKSDEELRRFTSHRHWTQADIAFEGDEDLEP